MVVNKIYIRVPALYFRDFNFGEFSKIPKNRPKLYPCKITSYTVLGLPAIIKRTFARKTAPATGKYTIILIVDLNILKK